MNRQLPELIAGLRESLRTVNDRLTTLENTLDALRETNRIDNPH